MNGKGSYAGRGYEAPVASQWVAVIAYAMVVVVFLADWFTPSSVIVGLAYEAPVAFAALRGTPKQTSLTFVLGLVGIVLGWFMDLAAASFQFNAERIENRLLSVVSLLIVAALAIIIQRSAQRTTELNAQRALRREATVSSAVDRVMSSLATGGTIEAVTAEAPQMLEAAAAVWCPTGRDGTFFMSFAGTSEATPLAVSQETSHVLMLVQRVKSQRAVDVVRSAETIELLTGKSFACKDALAIPITIASETIGILFAAFDTVAINDGTRVAATSFARFASTAVRESRLVESIPGNPRLRERPDTKRGVA